MKRKQMILTGASEIVLALALFWVAPTFLNSRKPWLGFAILLGVPIALVSSGTYAIAKLHSANQAKRIFVATFPEYANLGISKFLELSPAQVNAQLDLLIAIKETSEIQELNIFLFEILEQTKNDKL